MKRIYLVCIAWRLDLSLFFAQIAAQSSVRIFADAEQEANRARAWMMHLAKELRAAQNAHVRAVLAVQRHERHTDLGILP